MPASAGMTACFTLFAQNRAHVCFAHISQKLASPEGGIVKTRYVGGRLERNDWTVAKRRPENCGHQFLPCGSSVLVRYPHRHLFFFLFCASFCCLAVIDTGRQGLFAHHTRNKSACKYGSPAASGLMNSAPQMHPRPPFDRISKGATRTVLIFLGPPRRRPRKPIRFISAHCIPLGARLREAATTY